MLAYTYIEKGNFALVEMPKPMLIEATDEEFIFPVKVSNCLLNNDANEYKRNWFALGL